MQYAGDGVKPSRLDVSTNQQLRAVKVQFADHTSMSDLGTFWSNMTITLCEFLEGSASHPLSMCKLAIPRLLSAPEAMTALEFGLRERLHRVFRRFRGEPAHLMIVPSIADANPWSEEAQEDETTRECVRLLLGYDYDHTLPFGVQQQERCARRLTSEYWRAMRGYPLNALLQKLRKRRQLAQMKPASCGRSMEFQKMR